MNKRLLKLIVIFLVCTFFITGCKKSNETGNNNNGNQEQVTLIWWNMFESEENVKPLIDAYKAIKPNVVIQYKQQGLSGGVTSYRNLLDTALTDSEEINDPDIFTLENTWVGKYTQYIMPAPADVISSDYYEDFYPVIKDDFLRVDTLGVPLYVDTLAVIYNKDKLIEAGYSIPDNDWSEFKKQALSLTQKGSNNSIVSAGFAGASGNNVQFNFDIISLLMLQNGADLNSEGVLSNFADNEVVIDSFNFYKEFSGNNGSWDNSQKLDVASFLEGRLAMFIAPSWRLNDILIYNETYNLNLDIGIAPIPQLTGTDNMNLATYWGQTVSKASPNSREAWEFIKFVTEKEQLRMLDTKVKEGGRKVGIFYPRISMSSEISGDEYLRVYVQSMPFAKSWYTYDGYVVEEEFNKFFTEGSGDLNSLQGIINKTVIQN